MDNTTAAAIQRAYQLIKEGKHQEAQAILIPIVKEDQNISEAWYLLGLAISDPEKRLYAFQQVIRIDPSNALAQKEIAQLRPDTTSASAQEQPPAPLALAPEPELELVPAPEPILELPDIPQPDPEAALPIDPKLQSALRQRFADLDPEPVHPIGGGKQKLKKKKHTSRSAWLLATVVILIAGVAAAGLWVVYGGLPAMNGLPFLAIPTSTAVMTPTPRPSPTLTPTAQPSPSPTPLFTPVFRGTSCPFEVPLGTRVRCGVVRVPQDREKNFTDLIELPVIIYQSEKPDADVVMFLQGGPGVESLDWSLALFKDYVSPILQEHDMVFFDPRGTGRSKPALNCPELNKVFIDAYFQNRLADDAFRDFTAAWSKCHDRFVAEGIDPAAFNTTQSAADVHDIVQALGYQKVNLLGISYGTRLGLTVMRDYPEIIRSAVLDSVVPLEAKMFNRRGTDVEYALNKVFSDCADSPVCNGAYPDLSNIFNTLVERFDKQPVTIKAADPATGFVTDVKVNGVDMLSAIVSGLHHSELVPVVPKAIYDIQKGDYTFLSFALGVPGGEYNTLGMGTYFATVCPEQVYASTPQEIDSDLNISPLIKSFSLAGLFGSSQNVFDLCHSWGARTHQALDSLPVKTNIPTLVISGQYDPTTPVLTGQMVANDLPDSDFYVIPGMGHGATIGNDCSFGIMMSFFKDPAKAPDSSCLQLQAFDFFIPYDGKQPVPVVPMNDSSLHLKGVIPARWKKSVLYSVYSRHAYLFDPTLVEFESFSAAKGPALTVLSQTFADRGFEIAPRKISTRSANGLSWTIYQSKFNGEPVLLALVQINSQQTLAFLMVVSAPERDAFYNGLFIPMLDALTYTP